MQVAKDAPCRAVLENVGVVGQLVLCACCECYMCTCTWGLGSEPNPQTLSPPMILSQPGGVRGAPRLAATAKPAASEPAAAVAAAALAACRHLPFTVLTAAAVTTGLLDAMHTGAPKPRFLTRFVFKSAFSFM